MKRLNLQRFLRIGGKKDISVFWKHMLMMLVILALCLIALLTIHRTSLNTLTREQLEKIQLTLNRDCDVLDSTMYSTFAVPAAIEESRHYYVVANERSGVLEEKYYPQLMFIRGSLYNQQYLLSESEAYLIYMSGTNSVCGNSAVSAKAEEYFENYLTLTKTGNEVLLGYLKEKGTVQLLPMQTVRQQNANRSVQCMGLIIHPSDSLLAIMTLYSEEYLLEALSIPDLPEGTYMQMSAKDGQILAQYPAPVDDKVPESGYELRGEMNKLGATVTIWVPHSHFRELLQPVRRIGIITILLVLIAGAGLAVLFSRVSVVPIRQLIRTHGEGNGTPSSNEITHLDRLLSGAQEKAEQVQTMLVRQILARALSGAILTEQDERQLREGMEHLADNYRVAILHTTREMNEVLGIRLQERMEDALWALVSSKETGLVLRGDEVELEKLETAVRALIDGKPPIRIMCGISAPAGDLAAIHKAIRQARAALPQECGIKLFPGEEIRSHAISWLQHERLYQSIFENEEESAVALLNMIAKKTNGNNAREVFYNVRFVIHSAAEEMDIPLPEKQDLEYQPDLLPRENIQGLERMLRTLFSCIREKNEGVIADKHLAVLDYIQKNLGDYELCAASAAKASGIPEQSIYKVVRAQTGQSFGEYVQQQRMKLATALLYTTKLSNVEIARRCGYRIPSTFYRRFRDEYGISPGEYRSSNGPKKTQKVSGCGIVQAEQKQGLADVSFDETENASCKMETATDL